MEFLSKLSEKGVVGFFCELWIFYLFFSIEFLQTPKSTNPFNAGLKITPTLGQRKKSR